VKTLVKINEIKYSIHLGFIRIRERISIIERKNIPLYTQRFINLFQKIKINQFRAIFFSSAILIILFKKMSLFGNKLTIKNPNVRWN
jgi:hypothetical protein